MPAGTGGYPLQVSVTARARHLYASVETLLHEVAKFGVIGAVNYALDVAVFNLLVVGALHHKPITAKVISTVLAATSSYFMNRHWTWRDRARTGLRREYTLFILLSAIGLGITLACLAFSEYALGLHSLLARNIAGNVVGVGLGMVWRFWSFKRWVFLDVPAYPVDETLATEDAAETTIRTTV
jgi:putative flippase GtrA